VRHAGGGGEVVARREVEEATLGQPGEREERREEEGRGEGGAEEREHERV
jgi:hypothetical protein